MEFNTKLSKLIARRKVIETRKRLNNIIFRGNYTEFIQLYKEIYSDKDVIVNEDGKIVLDY